MPIPTNRTFEFLATKPDDEEEKELFLNFISALLWWLPEEIFDSFQVFSHLWINRAMQKNQQAEDEESSQGETDRPHPVVGEKSSTWNRLHNRGVEIVKPDGMR